MTDHSLHVVLAVFSSKQALSVYPAPAYLGFLNKLAQKSRGHSPGRQPWMLGLHHHIYSL
jgi:hypothetical protein